MTIRFETERLTAQLLDPQGKTVERKIEVRTHPLSGRKSRVTFSRQLEVEPGSQKFPPRPPTADDTDSCPFCPDQLTRDTPRLIKALCPDGRLICGSSVLFPNLFPYGAYSAVSLFSEEHFVEIGTASEESYSNSFQNCADYLGRVYRHDKRAVFTAITQNHLPSAGGSLVHPHLQVHADHVGGNHHTFLLNRADEYFHKNGFLFIGDYLKAEKRKQQRLIGITGKWHWLAAFAPEGFFEIWAILPGICSISEVEKEDWDALAEGVINVQHFYRSLGRNGYNLGLISVENGQRVLELRMVILARSNYAPWVRSDHTSYEIMLGDMATFNAPEQTAALAREFWD
jgi:UDPglucose--hexose-1-phosphate uridylyltransferase